MTTGDTFIDLNNIFLNSINMGITLGLIIIILMIVFRRKGRY